MAEAGVDVIDINMGCPSKEVTGGQSGSALMRDLGPGRRDHRRGD
jgi:tRNA-dihydrouridine synthase B